MVKIVGTTAVAAFAVGSFAAAGTMTLDFGPDAKLNAQDFAAVVKPVAATDSEVEVTTETVQNTLKHGSVEKKDPYAFAGTEKIVTEGSNGTELVSYIVKTIDGVEVEREQSISVVVDEPTDEVVSVGTLSIPQASNAGANRALGKKMAASLYGWTGSEWNCLNVLWTRESNWRHNAHNSSSGAHGIPQSLPGSKMAKYGSDWATNPATQIEWGLDYVQRRYDTPCGAWGHFQSIGWY